MLISSFLASIYFEAEIPNCLQPFARYYACNLFPSRTTPARHGVLFWAAMVAGEWRTTDEPRPRFVDFEDHLRAAWQKMEPEKGVVRPSLHALALDIFHIIVLGTDDYFS